MGEEPFSFEAQAAICPSGNEGFGDSYHATDKRPVHILYIDCMIRSYFFKFTFRSVCALEKAKMIPIVHYYCLVGVSKRFFSPLENTFLCLGTPNGPMRTIYTCRCVHIKGTQSALGPVLTWTLFFLTWKRVHPA